MDNKQYYTVIESNTNNLKMDLQELSRYKDLIFLFVKRDFISMYKQTILGPMWIVINPLITSVIFTFIFGGLAGLSTEGIPQFLFYMAGNTMWTMFSSAVTGTSSTLIANAAVFGKVYFPRLTVPISRTIFSFMNFCVQFAILLIAAVIYYFTGTELRVSGYVFIVPILVLQCMALAFGVGIIVSSLTVRYRDLANVVGFAIQLWMYCTPVVYAMDSTGGYMYQILLLNPMTPIIQNFRFALFGAGSFLGWSWALSAIVTIVLMMIGIVLFNKIEKTFMDTV